MTHSKNTLRVEAMGTTTNARLFHPGEHWVLGADESCDLILRDSWVSPRHCALRHLGAEVELEDCSEREGIRLAGAYVPRARLPLEGSFEIGRTRVTLRRLPQARGEILPGLVGRSPPMRELARLVERAASLDVAVLVRGESGTGKELVARAIHAASQRRDGPFVALNGASLSDALGASELFGHVRGAFTGAMESRSGAFRSAHGGTLFVDEVAAMPIPVQALLLRTLETGTVVAVGDDGPSAVDVRVVAATCEPIERRVDDGTFRADLYQRLAGCVIPVPSLRERRSDLPALAQRVLSEAFPSATVTAEAIEALRAYSFPGNVRELRNVLVQAAVYSQEGIIYHADVEAVLRARAVGTSRSRSADGDSALALLRACGGNISAAARRAGMARSTFRDRLRLAQSELREREEDPSEPCERQDDQKAPTTPSPLVSPPTQGTTTSAPVVLLEPPEVSMK